MASFDIGLSAEVRAESIALLTQYLADSHVLFTKTQGFHWNVVSPHFQPLHAVFQEQYEAIAESIDETAERIRMLGELAPASLKGFLEQSQLEEGRGDVSDQDMLKWLLGDHELLIRWLRSAIAMTQAQGDEGTADYFIGRLRAHEKTAWMLRSTIVG